MEKRVIVLLVENEPDYAAMVREAIQGISTPHEVHAVQSGEDAIAYLSGEGQFADRAMYPLPLLLLLDLKMPGIGGAGVLRWLQAHPQPELNVVVLSSMQSSEEMAAACQLGAQIYWVKPDCLALQEKLVRLEGNILPV